MRRGTDNNSNRFGIEIKAKIWVLCQPQSFFLSGCLCNQWSSVHGSCLSNIVTVKSYSVLLCYFPSYKLSGFFFFNYMPSLPLSHLSCLEFVTDSDSFTQLHSSYSLFCYLWQGIYNEPEVCSQQLDFCGGTKALVCRLVVLWTWRRLSSPKMLYFL